MVDDEARDMAVAHLRRVAERMKRAYAETSTMESLLARANEAVAVAVDTLTHLIEHPDCGSWASHLMRTASTFDVVMYPVMNAFGGGGTFEEVKKRLEALTEERTQLRIAEVMAVSADGTELTQEEARHGARHH